MRYLPHRQVLLSLALVSCIVFTACPKISQPNLDRAAKASNTIATRYIEVVQFVDTLWETKVIKDLATKDRIADALIVFGEGGKKFNGLLLQMSQLYKDGNVPPSGWKVIVDNFDALSREFLQVLNLLPGAAGLSSNPAFRAISAAILAIAQTLTSVGVNTPNMQRLQREVMRYELA
jgi:hypothetical protein